ncbi:ATP-binding protein [Breznakiella homolactica]|uniref:ATP-binding protein n=1 Tax=Breznakiella homolactica TaxID=2798577 RepID=A0A7T7XRA1_9SPIR|nr:ATP-binding protein [Breznakiella homolactica]QQO11035.1 ATP-binding protein [Breznakiella homolactica]
MHFSLSDLVTDITQNAAESGATEVEAEIRETPQEFRFLVRDNGKGMSQEELKRAIDPFETDGEKHPNRRVGLGIPFLIQTAFQSGGGWDLKSEKNKGTTVTAWFDTANVDTPPVGDIPGMFRTLLLFPGPGEVILRRFYDDGKKQFDYEIRKSELADALGDLEDVGSLVLLDKYLRSMEEDDEETE